MFMMLENMNMKENLILNDDCLNYMKNIKDKSIDMVCCDLPYGKTKNKWDSILDLKELWSEYKRIVKDNGNIILFGMGSFSAKLILSNEDMYKYSLVWEKTTPTGHLNAKKQPLRIHEDILVYYNKGGGYNPQKTTGHTRKIITANHKRNSIKTSNYNDHKLTGYDSTERYPTSVLKFPTDRQKSALHPTQKPVALIEYLIKMYSNENDLILDNCAGSFTTSIACLNTNRNYICIEKDEKYFNIGKNRIQKHIII